MSVRSKRNTIKLPSYVKLVEVGPRDGLQNEPRLVPTHIKVKLIEKLIESGLSCIEVTSFVSPKRVPQMADHTEIMKLIPHYNYIEYPVLVPNIEGLNNALAAGAKYIAFFAAASQTFSKKNTNCSIEESIKRFSDIVTVAKPLGIKIRGYISCVLGCPYEGSVEAKKVAELAHTLLDMGCDEISLGDTIGIGTIISTQKLIYEVQQYVPHEVIAIHFHDTYGQALANIFAALQMGVSIIDSSVSGLGGCPYARGATGNVASEDVLYMLEGLEIETNVSLPKLIDAGNFISNYIGKINNSKTSLAFQTKNC